MAHASKGEPISILKIAEDKVTIDVNAIKSIFEKIGNCYFAIYSINGPKRTGKSYMLSNFIRYLNQQSTSKHHGNDWVLNSGNIHTFPWRGESQPYVVINLGLVTNLREVCTNVHIQKRNIAKG